MAQPQNKGSQSALPPPRGPAKSLRPGKDAANPTHAHKPSSPLGWAVALSFSIGLTCYVAMSVARLPLKPAAPQSVWTLDVKTGCYAHALNGKRVCFSKQELASLLTAAPVRTARSKMNQIQGENTNSALAHLALSNRYRQELSDYKASFWYPFPATPAAALGKRSENAGRGEHAASFPQYGSTTK